MEVAQCEGAGCRSCTWNMDTQIKGLTETIWRTRIKGQSDKLESQVSLIVFVIIENVEI